MMPAMTKIQKNWTKGKMVHINIYAKDLIAEFEEAMKERTEVEEPDR